MNRGYELLIGDYRRNEATKITELQCEFDIVKSTNNKDKSNSATIEIYNLPKEVIRELEEDFIAAAFSAGYHDTQIKRLFGGTVTRVSTRKSGADTITQVVMGSGYVELNHTTLSKLVPPGKTIKDVFEEVRTSLPNVSRGVYAGVNINSKVVSGYPLMGEPKRLMDALSRAYSVDWRVDDDVLYVNDSDDGINAADSSAYVISESSGLIDIPYLVQSEGRKKKEDKEKKISTQFRILLNPDVNPGEIVRLEFEEFTGWYKVDSVRHFGSYRGNDWYTEVNAKVNVKG